MKTIELRLEPDREMPVFQRLRYEWTEASLRGVLLMGIHPWGGPHVHRSLLEACTQRLNLPELKPNDLESHGFCWDLHPSSSYYHYRRSTPLEHLLTKVGEQMAFVDEGFAYPQLLSLARDWLSQRWTHSTVRGLLQAMSLDFASLRRFIKSRASQVRLRGYADLDRYDLSGELALEDFQDQEDLLIRQAMPGLNVRLTTFLSKVTDEQGRLRLIPEITDFQLRVMQSTSKRPFEALTYNCHRQGERVRLIPHLGEGRPGARELARQMASHWTQGRRHYCFTVGLEELSQMLKDGGTRIDFSSLSYTDPKGPPVAEARVPDLGLVHYQVGAPITREDTAETMREMLRSYGVSMSGNKRRLVEKLARLSAKVYREHEAEMDAYFQGADFIRSGGRDDRCTRLFPLLEDCPLRDMVLTMYLLRHLRGDAIVEASYVDDSYDLNSLALALLKERVSLQGAFLRVEDWPRGSHLKTESIPPH